VATYNESVGEARLRKERKKEGKKTLFQFPNDWKLKKLFRPDEIFLFLNFQDTVVA